VRARLVLVGTVVLIGSATFAGCSSGPSDEAQTASIVCEELRAHDDRLVDLVNASVAGIGELPEGERSQAISAGFDQVADEVDDWQRRVQTIDLGDVAEADELRAQLSAGADQARDELADQRSALRTGAIPDREVQGAVGEWFNSVEKVMSVSEPEIFRFERPAFKQAFLDEPACRHVIQPFVDD
jgi:hypothetical protein